MKPWVLYSNPSIARAHISRENHVTCDLRRVSDHRLMLYCFNVFGRFSTCCSHQTVLKNSLVQVIQPELKNEIFGLDCVLPVRNLVL